jgi:pyruvate kinase
VQLPHPEIFAAVKAGEYLLLNDGRLRLEVTDVSPQRIETRVVFGGDLTARKGLNLPDTIVPLTALTDKDRADLEAAATLGVDWIAQSFVQRPEDVAEARDLINGRAGLMVKIEKPAALRALDQILELCDSMMVARGDLGVELPLEAVPGWQKRLTRAARRAGKPVVVATQMLESMIEEPVPTRAEVSDVATAVFEGADAVMLSAESATGAWPDKAVMTMDSIARSVEHDPLYRGIIHAQRTEPEATTPDAISNAARTVAETLQVAAIVCYTGSGSTGLRVARERPEVPIIALTPRPETGRRLAVVWGLHCVLTEDARDLDDMVLRACRIAVEEGFAKVGDRIVITAGVPLRTPGKTNMLRIATIRGPGVV